MREALQALGRGRVVSAATESFFGLLADAARPDAIDRLLALKPRGADKGMPLLLPSRAAWVSLVSGLPPLAQCLADALWPGPLSIALPAASDVDERLTLDPGLQSAFRGRAWLPSSCAPTVGRLLRRAPIPPASLR